MRILRWGIYAIVFCLPLYLVRFRIFGIPTTVLELMIYGLFIFWLINNLKKSAFFAIVKKADFLIITIILILVGVSLATVFSLDLRTSAGIWKAWFVDPILFFVVLISVIKNSEQVKKVLYSLFLSGTVVSIISLIYLILGKLDSVGRLQGFYDSPNYLAMYLAPMLILGFGLWIMTKNRLGKVLLFIASCFMFYALWHIKSYGAWMGIMAAIGFALILNCFKLKKIQLAILLSCLFLLAGLFLGSVVLNVRTESLSARLAIWQQAWGVFKTNMILGIGPGTFEGYPQPHNIFLAFLLQTGIIGFIGLIGLLIWFFRAGIKLLNVNCYVLIVACIMVYILVHGLVDTTYWKNDLAIIFWLVVGLMAVVGSQSFISIVKKS